jgi:hypothetical protein
MVRVEVDGRSAISFVGMEGTSISNMRSSVAVSACTSRRSEAECRNARGVAGDGFDLAGSVIPILVEASGFIDSLEGVCTE